MFSAGRPVEGGFRLAADVPLHPPAQADQTSAEVDECPPPAAEVLTVPRVSAVAASACWGLVLITGGLVVLLLFTLLNPTQMNAPYFYLLKVGVTAEGEVYEEFGVGQLGVDGCSRFRSSHNPDLAYKLCFNDGKLSSRKAGAPGGCGS